MTEHLDEAYRVGVRRACRVIALGRSTYYYLSIKDDRALLKRILEIAEARVRYGYKRIHVLFRPDNLEILICKVFKISLAYYTNQL